jgi:hypothetical protein
LDEHESATALRWSRRGVHEEFAASVADVCYLDAFGSRVQVSMDSRKEGCSSGRPARSTAEPKALRCQREGSDYACTWSAVSAELQGACSMTWGSVSADRSFIASGFHPAFPQNSRPIWSRKSCFCGNRLFALSRPVGQLFREPVDQLHPRLTPFSHRNRLPNFTEAGHLALSRAGRSVSPRSVDPFCSEWEVQLCRDR